jgi:hypothetical protein
MADYYPVLARAVSSLAVNNAQTREELYEHARTVLVAELERNNPDQLKRLYVSGSNLKRPLSEWRQNRNLDTRKAPGHYYIAFMSFVSNMESKSLLLRQCRILPLYCVNLRASLARSTASSRFSGGLPKQTLA